jgi:hypothetical protein
VIERARATTEFAQTGMSSGSLGGVHWVIVDPVRHPITVWRGRPSPRRVSALDAVVVTNGPMTGRRLLHRWKVTRPLLLGLSVTSGSIIGLAAACSAAGLVHPGHVGRQTRAQGVFWPSVTSVAFGLAGAASTFAALLSGWVPCGVVRGVQAGIEDRRDFDGEGADHAWFARLAGDRATEVVPAAIGDGPLPEAAVEGIGGLVRLVRDGRIPDGGDLSRLADRRSAVAWAVVPSRRGDESSLDSVLIVGSGVLDLTETAEWLRAFGARDAVAADPSGCTLLAVNGKVLVGPPVWARRRIQRYGLACGARP